MRFSRLTTEVFPGVVFFPIFHSKKAVPTAGPVNDDVDDDDDSEAEHENVLSTCSRTVTLATEACKEDMPSTLPTLPTPLLPTLPTLIPLLSILPLVPRLPTLAPTMRPPKGEEEEEDASFPTEKKNGLGIKGVGGGGGGIKMMGPKI